MSKKQKPNIVSVTKHDGEFGMYRISFSRKVHIRTDISNFDLRKGSGYYIVNMADELEAYNKANELISEGKIS